MVAVPVTFRVTTDEVIPALLDGVLVQVYSSPGDSFITSGTTGTPTPGSGEVELTLDSSFDYLIRLSKSDTSFPVGLPITISVLDPPAINELDVTAHVGPTSVVVSLTLEDEVGDPIDNVNVKIFDNTDIFLTESVTGLIWPGIVDFILPGVPDPGQQYIVRWRPPEGTEIQNGSTQIIAVFDPLTPPETNIFDFVAEEIELPASDDPTMCLMSGYLADLSKGAIYQGTLVFMPILNDPDVKVSGFPFPTSPAVSTRKMLVSEAKFITDRDGYIECKLPQGGIYNVHLYGLETPGFQQYAQVYIPNSTSAKLEDVLLPYVASVDTDAGSVGVLVGESIDLPLTALGSNDQPIIDSYPAGLLDLVSSDEEVAVPVFADGILRISGVSSGSATITISRKDDTSATRVPAIPDLVVTPATVITVTVT